MQRRDKESEKSLANVIMCLRKIGLMAKGKSQMQVVLMDHRLQICMHLQMYRFYVMDGRSILMTP